MKLKAWAKEQDKEAVGLNIPPPSDISVQRLIDDSLLALYREVKNLLLHSAKGKLSPSDARDLRDHTKLLFDLKDREDKTLSEMTDDELKEVARKILAGEIKGNGSK